MRELIVTASRLVVPGKGLLAADESPATIGRRFTAVGVENTEEHRRAYRQMLLTTKGIAAFISGVILHDETTRQNTDDGTPLARLLEREGMIVGIKVDEGAKPLAGSPGELVTEGLDGLRARLVGYRQLGARFAKWRAVIQIAPGLPTPTCVEANAEALARYAALCQENGLVPIVEPEVLIDGDHTIERCFEVTEAVQHAVFAALYRHHVDLEATLLKPSMVLSGNRCAQQAGVTEVATATLRCLRRTVPAAVPGILFLSGGQPAQAATAHLNAMNSLPGPRPWTLSFSYSRALQEAPLETWKGDAARVAAAQKAFYHRAKCNSAAATGRYTTALEGETAA
jgi:fructose-bisphosphate aldolase class I